MKNYLIFFFVLFTFASRANNYREIVTVLKHIESNNNPHAIGDGGDSYGVLQVQKAAVIDVNRYYGTRYTHEQMFNASCAEEVTILYMKMGAELYEKRYGKCPTEEVLVRNHNGGIYQGYKVKSTMNYYRKYLKFKSKLNY
jgi:hypothetical protein